MQNTTDMNSLQRDTKIALNEYMFTQCAFCGHVINTMFSYQNALNNPYARVGWSYGRSTAALWSSNNYQVLFQIAGPDRL